MKVMLFAGQLFLQEHLTQLNPASFQVLPDLDPDMCVAKV